MCYINNDFFFPMICITFYRRKSNTLPISKSVLIASLHKIVHKVHVIAHISLQYTSSYTEWMQKMPLIACVSKKLATLDEFVNGSS